MITYSLKETGRGQWSVCRAGISLFSGLPLASAIRLAREVARDEHLRSARDVCVEIPGPETAIRLAQFLRPAESLKAAA